MTNKINYAFYIKLQGRAHSKAVQNRLFDLGIKWKKGYKAIVRHSNKPHLYVTLSGYIYTRYRKVQGTKAKELTVLDLYTPQILESLGL